MTDELIPANGTDLPNDEHEYELEMPFVIVKSMGGPFDDVDFACGWQCGQIDTTLRLASAFVERVKFPIVHSDVLPQLELIGMRHKFPIVTASGTDEHGEWLEVTFERE